MKLQDKLAELNYKQVEDNYWQGQGADGKSEVHLCVLESGKVEVVKKPNEEDIPPTIITFSQTCDALLELLDRWTWY